MDSKTETTISSRSTPPPPPSPPPLGPPERTKRKATRQDLNGDGPRTQRRRQDDQEKWTVVKEYDLRTRDRGKVPNVQTKRVTRDEESLKKSKICYLLRDDLYTNNSNNKIPFQDNVLYKDNVVKLSNLYNYVSEKKASREFSKGAEARFKDRSCPMEKNVQAANGEKLSMHRKVLKEKNQSGGYQGSRIRNHECKRYVKTQLSQRVSLPIQHEDSCKNFSPLTKNFFSGEGGKCNSLQSVNSYSSPSRLWPLSILFLTQTVTFLHGVLHNPDWWSSDVNRQPPDYVFRRYLKQAHCSRQLVERESSREIGS